MANSWFQFKEFKINQDKTAMKVGVDGVLSGAVSHLSRSMNVLDIGAGTGLLSLMAVQRSDAQVTALEIEKNAFNQCVENIKLNKQEDRITALNVSFQDYYKECKEKFDFIICNPPFFNNSFKSPDEKRNIARHSHLLPKEELIKGVSEILIKNGIFSVILPFESELIFEQMCNNYGLFCRYKLIISPRENKKPNRIIIEFSGEKEEILIENIAIRENDTNQYTKAYKKLTKDFYLHF